ncbi:hypothetical protein FS749_011286, partial [Ceratobasidium sp. UAMH 11750]
TTNASAYPRPRLPPPAPVPTRSLTFTPIYPRPTAPAAPLTFTMPLPRPTPPARALTSERDARFALFRTRPDAAPSSTFAI